VFASSACAYPVDLQTDMSKPAFLSEEQIDYKNIRQPDGEYGFGKLGGEIALNAYVKDGHFSGVACRFFTVMGVRMKPNHAILALIAKTFVKQDPYQIWGNPNVIRNWTWVGDTVNGLVLAAEKLNSGAVNIGLEEPITVHQAVETVWDAMGWRPTTYQYDSDAPVGVVSRVANSEKAHKELGWYPQVSFKDGVAKIVDWYTSTHNVDEVKISLEKSLTAR
jgi:nucleoside-diphosphate-sugar epimerase